MPTIIGLLRHGQTDWNVEMRLQGISDIPMNVTGHEQARIAAKVIAGQGWTRVISSPLGRAVDTANYVLSELNLNEVEIHPLLLERSFGISEGSSYEQWRERLQAGVVAEGAETAEGLESRAFKLLDELAISYQNEKVVAVSHGALIRKIIDLVSNGELPRDGERFGNASMTTIVHNGTAWGILDYNPETLKL